jgi:hypothetical protein
MGNSSNRDKDLTIYIETEKSFYNSGSNIDGVVFVEAKKNFAFDALYIRVEGTPALTQETNGANGSREALKIGRSILAVRISMRLSICSKNTIKVIFRREAMLTPSQLSYPKISRALLSRRTTMPKSSTN